MLVKISAAGVNPLDNMISRGEVKMIVPYKLPTISGNEFVGIVQEVADIFESLQIQPSIDTVYSFDNINAALDKVANGRSKGKTIITMTNNQ